MPPTWIFDLDNTLHNADAGIFPHISRSMTHYIMRQLGLNEMEAQALRRHYYLRYGATMHGMRRHHAIDPDVFLRETHALEELVPLIEWDHRGVSLLAHLPGRKILLSNGPQAYVEQITRHMGIDRLFHALYGIERVGYRPKPNPLAFITVCARERLAPASCIMVEDSLENLRTAKSLGMRTVWLSLSPRRPVYVDHRIRTLRDLPRLPKS
ncbi:MAG: pyrimidine 5'-nucleotidase [Paludibacterium sp.]|uniref:pyrimidine 5'-nucleotidase n=1 Tax=Paludibacterium sp. TaxID=1917523 RepID=UPI0025F55E8A|nr:pyrimidine 5'-nucleotidase [Paludibacterium sp.]MBV8049457.1 pyrimidine 5'-nucleotidase [Paludibacterium sp.]